MNQLHRYERVFALTLMSALLVLIMPGVCPAQESETVTLDTLPRIIQESNSAIEEYLSRVPARDLKEILKPLEEKPTVLKALRQQLIDYEGFARQLTVCLSGMGVVVETVSSFKSEQLFTSETFKGRFDSDARRRVFAEKLSGLANEISDCRVNRLLPAGTRPVRCCNKITLERNAKLENELEPELTLTSFLGERWETYTEIKELVENTIQTNKKIVGQFRRKLLDGFPIMPWEAALNLHGDDNGPSPHQIIWAHFNMGFEDGVQVDPGDNRIQPVLTLQGLGYNRYFLSKDKGVWRKLNYLGVAGIITLNGRKGVKTIRYGGVVHFGNYVSVGGTYGDHVWRVYASSNKVVDQILKIWN